MSQTKSFVMLAGAALSLGCVNAALAQQQSNPDEVRAIVAEMLSDAETRSSLLAGGGAGHDGRFFLANADGSFRLNVGGQLTERYIIGFRDDQNVAGIRPGDDFTTGFQNRYTKLWFDGNIAGTDWTYMIRGNFGRGLSEFGESSSGNGNFALENAWIGYNFGSGWKMRGGQFKLPFAQEALVDDQFQLAADRSVVDSIFNQGYSQGVEVSYEALDWRIKAAFSDGFATANTDYPNVPTVGSDFAFTGRFEYKFAGTDFAETFKDFTSEQGKPFACLLGVAAHYQDSANSNAPTDVDVQYLGYTADVTFKGDGWNAFIAGEGRHTDSRGPVGSGNNNPEFDDFGLVAQAGFRVQPNTEIFARYDGIFLDSSRNLNNGSNNDNFSFITGGVNQYFAGHAAKATADIVYSVDDTRNLFGASTFGPGFPNTALGLLGSSKDGEVAIRLQFQLLF